MSSFEDEYSDDEGLDVAKSRLKIKQSPGSSTRPKRPSKDEFEKKVSNHIQKDNSYKSRAKELSEEFDKMLNDKTLVANKTIFAPEVERELISKMAKLAEEINLDQSQKEGMGSLMWIPKLLSIVLRQKDRINQLEYMLDKLDKNIQLVVASEIKKALDKSQSSG